MIIYHKDIFPYSLMSAKTSRCLRYMVKRQLMKKGAMRCGFDISDQNRKTKFPLKRIFVSG